MIMDNIVLIARNFCGRGGHFFVRKPGGADKRRLRNNSA